MPSGAQHDELAQTFAVLSRSLLNASSVDRTVSKICELAVLTVPGCDHAGISLVRGTRIATEGASDDVPTRVDALQYETGQGPCLSAIRDEPTYYTDDLAREERWPQFASRAARETGVHSMLSFRLFARGDTLGALNLYSQAIGAFTDEDDRAIGSIFAAHGAIALSGAQMHARVDQLEEALESRDLIGQAKGLLMARENVSADEAFAMLRRASQRLNVKLRIVATDMIESARPNAP